MKKESKKNIYLSALFRMMLICASVHMVLLIIYAVINNQMILLNLFNIIDLDLVFPGIEQGNLSAFLSIALGFTMYFTILILMKRKPINTSAVKSDDKDRQ